MAYVQLKAGHSQSAITERCIHAAQVLYADLRIDQPQPANCNM